MKMGPRICFLDIFSLSRGTGSFCVDSGPVITHLFILIFTMQFSPSSSHCPQKRLWAFHTDKALSGDTVHAYPHTGGPPCLDYLGDFAIPGMPTFLSRQAVLSFRLCFRICVFMYHVFH